MRSAQVLVCFCLFISVVDSPYSMVIPPVQSQHAARDVKINCYYKYMYAATGSNPSNHETKHEKQAKTRYKERGYTNTTTRDESKNHLAVS